MPRKGTVPQIRKAKVAEILQTNVLPPTPPPPPPAPEPPNPVVLALQEQILDQVNQRAMFQDELTSANAQIRRIQAEAESARECLQRIEGEVRYRLSLIAQLQGKPELQQMTLENSPYALIDTSMAIPFVNTPHAGVGSIPPRRAPMAGASDGVRTESAEEIRSML